MIYVPDTTVSDCQSINWIVKNFLFLMQNSDAAAKDTFESEIPTTDYDSDIEVSSNPFVARLLFY